MVWFQSIMEMCPYTCICVHNVSVWLVVTVLTWDVAYLGACPHPDMKLTEWPDFPHFAVVRIKWRRERKVTYIGVISPKERRAINIAKKQKRQRLRYDLQKMETGLEPQASLPCPTSIIVMSVFILKPRHVLPLPPCRWTWGKVFHALTKILSISLSALYPRL